MKDALLENSVLRVRLHYQRLVKYFIKLIVNLTVLSPIVLITPNNMLTISSNKIFRLDFCYNTAIPHKYSQNINFFFFFLTDPVSHEIILQSEGKDSSFPKWFYLDSTFYSANIIAFLVFSLFVSMSIYLISRHHHTTCGSNIAVASPMFSLRSGKNGVQIASC